MPIRLRLALIVAGGLTLLLAATGYAFVRQLHGSLLASIDSGLWVRHETVLASVRAHADPTALGATQILSAAGVVLMHSADEDGLRALITPRQARAALAGPLWVTTPLTGEDAPLRVLAFPLPPGAPGSVGVVQTSLALLDTADRHVRAGFLIGGPIIVLAGGLTAWLLAGAALRPVERMRRQAAAASAEGSRTILDVPGTRDELAALASTMNDLLHRLRAYVERERAFVADASHELRTPLAILRAELELAGKPGRSRTELVSAVAAAAEETERLQRLTEALLLLARGQLDGFLQRDTVGVAEVLQSAAAPYAAAAADAGVAVDIHVRPVGLTACWDPERMRQVVANLVHNAIRHSPRGGTVRLLADGFPHEVVVRVQDDGTGFPEHFLPHAFERFSRADEARSAGDGGAGLGLAIVAALVAAHGGTVIAGNRESGGGEVTLVIPTV